MNLARTARPENRRPKTSGQPELRIPSLGNSLDCIPSLSRPRQRPGNVYDVVSRGRRVLLFPGDTKPDLQIKNNNKGGGRELIERALAVCTQKTSFVLGADGSGNIHAPGPNPVEVSPAASAGRSLKEGSIGHARRRARRRPLSARPLRYGRCCVLQRGSNDARCTRRRRHSCRPRAHRRRSQSRRRSPSATLD